LSFGYGAIGQVHEGRPAFVRRRRVLPDLSVFWVVFFALLLAVTLDRLQYTAEVRS
jgi:hypothetical protein